MSLHPNAPQPLYPFGHQLKDAVIQSGPGPGWFVNFSVNVRRIRVGTQRLRQKRHVQKLDKY